MHVLAATADTIYAQSSVLRHSLRLLWSRDRELIQPSTTAAACRISRTFGILTSESDTIVYNTCTTLEPQPINQLVDRIRTWQETSQTRIMDDEITSLQLPHNHRSVVCFRTLDEHGSTAWNNLNCIAAECIPSFYYLVLFASVRRYHTSFSPIPVILHRRTLASTQSPVPKKGAKHPPPVR
jgi:hypothetical protein